MRQKQCYVYILTNKRNNVLYVGVTANLSARVWQHSDKHNRKSFTAKYSLDRLVYCEEYGNITEAIGREKQIKAGSRKKKIDLIESINPEWKDLLV